MQTNTSGANSPYDSDEVEQLARQVEALQETVADQAGRIGELEDEVEQKDARIEQLEAKVEDNEEEIEDEIERRSAEIEGCHARITNVEDEIDDLEDTEARTADDGGSNPQGVDEETTALEQVCALPEHVAKDQLTTNQKRARSVARRIEEYGRKVPAGIAITSSRIKRVLTAQEDSTIHRQTVSRVADFLERFGDGQVKIRETKGGKTTVVFDDQLVNDVTAVVTADTDDGVTPVTV